MAKEVLDLRREVGVPPARGASSTRLQEISPVVARRWVRELRDITVNISNQIEVEDCDWVTPTTPGLPPAMRRSVERENPVRRVGGTATRGYAVCPNRNDPNLQVFVLANCQSDPGTDVVDCVRDTRRLAVLSREAEGRPESPREQRGSQLSGEENAGAAQ